MREYQVRICERLGVQFPGPTRRERSVRGNTQRATRKLRRAREQARDARAVSTYGKDRAGEEAANFVPFTASSLSASATARLLSQRSAASLEPPPPDGRTHATQLRYGKTGASGKGSRRQTGSFGTCARFGIFGARVSGAKYRKLCAQRSILIRTSALLIIRSTRGW